MSKKKKGERKVYSETFKARALRLVAQSERSTSHIARELGIAEKTLLGWTRAARQREQTGEAQLSANEKDELKTLRKTVRRLEEETEILKKAATYFANLNR